MSTRGRLVYVMGPSGAGKDSLLNFARERAGNQALFVHRYITRPRAAGEDHVPLSAEEFAARKALDLFAMDWSSHGFHYGVGLEIDAWIERGATVVVNGSRNYLKTALVRYPSMSIVHVVVEPSILAARLAARGRESAQEVEARLSRQVSWSAPEGASVCVIDNSGPLSRAGEDFLRILRKT